MIKEDLVYLRDLFIDAKEWQEVSRLQYKIDTYNSSIYQIKKINKKVIDPESRDIEERTLIFLFIYVFNITHLLFELERLKEII